MSRSRIFCLVIATACLAACGASGSGTSTTSVYPGSGAYGWVLKATGQTTSLSYGLSFVHASTPAVEYQIESGSAVLTDVRQVSNGSVNTARRTATGLSPYALVYIIGGDVRRVPLQADGKAPATQVLRAGSTDACLFVTDSNHQRIGPDDAAVAQGKTVFLDDAPRLRRAGHNLILGHLIQVRARTAADKRRVEQPSLDFAQCCTNRRSVPARGRHERPLPC